MTNPPNDPALISIATTVGKSSDGIALIAVPEIGPVMALVNALPVGHGAPGRRPAAINEATSKASDYLSDSIQAAIGRDIIRELRAVREDIQGLISRTSRLP